MFKEGVKRRTGVRQSACLSRFYPRDAMLAPVLAMALCPCLSASVSVCLSCLSVCLSKVGVTIKKDKRINLFLARMLLSISH